MDIGAGIEQGVDLMRAGASYNADQMRVQEELNRKAVDAKNTTIDNANLKTDATTTASKYWDYYGEASEGVDAALTGAKVFSDARNFDSEVAGFGGKGIFGQSGKGADAFFTYQTQKNIVKGRFGQAKATLRRAVGADAPDSRPASAQELGLTQERFVGTEDEASRLRPGFRNINAPAPTPVERPQTLSNRIFGGERTGLGSPGEVRTFGRPAYTSGFETTIEPSPAGKVADETTEQGKAVIKASGGLFAGETAEAAEGGVKAGFIKKVGGFLSDMPAGQLGAVADILGKGSGFYGAGKSIYEDVSGERKDMTGFQKLANDADIISGGIDALSIALPILAPVGAVASAVTSGLDITAGAEAAEEQKEKDKQKADATLAEQEQKNQQRGVQVASLQSGGQIARAQVSAY